MPNTKITRQKWRDHLPYAKKIYIIGALVVIAATSLLFSVTRYTPPNEKAVLIELVDLYTDTTKLDADLPLLLQSGQAYDETLEDVSFYSISYSGTGDSDDGYGSQVYMVQIYAGENDIYLQDLILTQQLIDQGYCLPLDLMDGFDAFVKANPDAEILWQQEPDPEAQNDEDEEEDEDAEPRASHAYAVNISTLTGMAQRGAFSVKDKYAIVAYASKNPNTSFHVLGDMFALYAPAEATPGEATPDEAAPDEAAPDEAASSDAAPDGAAPDGAAPDGAAPDGAAPSDASPAEARP